MALRPPIDLHLTGIDGGLSLLLDDRLVDLQRPIEVRIDGRQVFHGLAQPALVALATVLASPNTSMNGW